MMHSDLRPRLKGPKNRFLVSELAVIMVHIFTGIPNCVWFFVLSTFINGKAIPVNRP
jgi:hypothetical protein